VETKINGSEISQPWVEYFHAKDVILQQTAIRHAPWDLVEADANKRAQLDGSGHFFSLIPY